jgi:hypothetical protein
MAWIVIEGIDRSFKSSAAKLYEAKGFKVIHFSAPDKKYYQPGYTGPTYFESLIEMMVSLSGQDVVFDRSWYGEACTWPQIYGRKSLLIEEDLDVLREFEEQNSVSRILMVDPDVEAHWKRCVDNKEPLTRSQFNSAQQLYGIMADRHGFEIKTMHDFVQPTQKVEEMQPQQTEPKVQVEEPTNVLKIDTPIKLTPEQLKLQQANAINDVLSSRVVKKKGAEYDQIESRIREFLNSELAKILGTNAQQPALPFTNEEVTLLKALANRVKDKRA